MPVVENGFPELYVSGPNPGRSPESQDTQALMKKCSSLFLGQQIDPVVNTSVFTLCLSVAIWVLPFPSLIRFITIRASGSSVDQTANSCYVERQAWHPGPFGARVIEPFAF